MTTRARKTISKPLTADELERVAQFFYRMLDDIDTVDDMAKFNDLAYREAVRRIIKKRWAAVAYCNEKVIFKALSKRRKI